MSPQTQLDISRGLVKKKKKTVLLPQCMAAHQKYQFHTWLEPIGGAVESLLFFLFLNILKQFLIFVRLFSRMLQRSFAVKLRKSFVDYDTFHQREECILILGFRDLKTSSTSAEIHASSV